jgi:hypothetical protein
VCGILRVQFPHGVRDVERIAILRIGGNKSSHKHHSDVNALLGVGLVQRGDEVVLSCFDGRQGEQRGDWLTMKKASGD